MNKKIIFYFLTALVVLTFKTDSSYSIPTISKYDENYWTSEKMKKAKLLKPKNIGFRTRSGVETIKNTTDSSKVTKSRQPFERKYDANTGVANVNIPIGRLFMSMDGEDFSCTASVIDTDGGNIGVSAAHCLYDHDTEQYFQNVMFSPGYDNGQPGPFGKVPIAKMVVTNEFLENDNNQFDWGMMLFNFNMDGHPLKWFTGSLGYTFQAGNNVPTTIRGYPDGGDLPNCPNDGETLCTWQGVTKIAQANDFYIVQDLNLGNGASGAPLIVRYDPSTNLGYLYSNYASFDELNDQLLAPIYNPVEFQALIGDLELH